MEERADFASELCFDEKIYCTGDTGKEASAKKQMINLIKCIISGAVMLAVPTYFILVGRDGGTNLLEFMLSGFAFLTLVPAIMFANYVRNIVRNVYGFKEYAVTDKSLVICERGGYTSYMYYGLVSVTVTEPRRDMYIDFNDYAVTGAVSGNYNRKTYQVVLQNVTDPNSIAEYMERRAKLCKNEMKYSGSVSDGNGQS